MKKYYIVSLKFDGYNDKNITLKAKNPQQAILKALREVGYERRYFQRVVSVEEIDIFECLKVNNND